MVGLNIIMVIWNQVVLMKRYLAISVILFLLVGCLPYSVFALDYGLDTSLANADGSFIGAASGNQLGDSVTIPGDLNGDGYDDILAVARAINTVYIIFGQPSDWNNDDSIANADASFVAESGVFFTRGVKGAGPGVRAAGVGLTVGVLSGVGSAADLANYADVVLPSVGDLLEKASM